MIYYLGIDIGGTKIKAVRMRDFLHAPEKYISLDTPKNKKTLEVALEQIITSFSGKNARGIAVGLPGIIDTKQGVLIKAPNLSFLDGWNVIEFFKKFNPTIKIDNDSRCFLRSEMMLGAGKNYSQIVAVTIGTGIGGGIAVNKKIIYGAHNSAGEFGHVIIDDGKTWENLGGKKAYENSGDCSKIIGIGVANIINALDPEIVILGGGGVTSSAVKIVAVKKTAEKYILSPRAQKTPIVKGKLGEYAQAMGATLLFRTDA